MPKVLNLLCKIKGSGLKTLVFSSEIKKYLLGLAVLFTSLDIIFIKQFYGIATFSMFFFWLLVIYLYKLKERHFVIAIVILFGSVAFFHIISVREITEKSAVWAYMFLIIYAFNLAKTKN